jgi:hypothetical protein
VVAVVSCSPEGAGLARAPEGSGAKVKFDAFHRPLPEIPLPNDFATRFDATSPTKRRINASMVAPTRWEQKTRTSLDELDGWGTLAPITVSFETDLDVENIIRRHHGDRYATGDDVLLLVDVTKGSPDFCQAMPVDLGEGLFPARLDRPEYYPADTHPGATSLLFEETEEDLDGDGELDPGEDTDGDGVLDHPNTRSKSDPTLLTFYERETKTLIARPVYPLREGTTYAVVLTRDLVDASGAPVRSPFRDVNHAAQTRALQPLADECLGALGRSLDDVAFTWSFTTQRWSKPLVAVRDGLYGLGPFARLATEFPAEMTLRDARARGNGVYTRLVPGDLFLQMAKSLYSQFGSGNSAAQEELFFKNFAFIDFHAVGTIDSPQFFPRFAEDGSQLPLTDQIWKLNAETGEAFTRHEGVNYWLMVPKNRNGKPAPVAIFVHGHGSTKFDAMNVAGFLARMGIATMGIDAVSHGVDVDPLTLEIVKGQFKQRGIEGMGQGIVEGRALDQNGDGKLDSGVDYWTAYLFHTRDVVRQTAVDLFQVTRTLRSFDGQKRWKYDANQDGQDDLAGDLDGDGTVDIGGNASIHLVGGSLGGIISSYVGGLEPHVETVIPIIGGGGLSDIGTRSSLSGVRDAMVLRMMSPLVLVHDGAVFEMAPDLVDGREVKVATLTTPPARGTMAVLKNLDTGEWRCGRVQADGRLRIAVPSDKGNRLSLSFYAGELKPREREGCEPDTGAPTQTISTFEADAKFQDTTYPAGSDFVAFTDGFGLRRGNPELRRMLGLSQVALEGADPANTAPFMHGERTLTFGTGETVQTRAFYINTMGDSGVPTASGVTLARAAGLIDFRSVDARYGKTVQQVLVDTGTVESAESSGRWKNARGEDVLMDVDDLQNIGAAGDGFDVPRLNPPLRIVRRNSAAQGGGVSAQLFPMMEPLGTHGFPQPKPELAFDLGSLLINQMIRYLATDGRELDFDPCQLDWSCSWLPPTQ